MTIICSICGYENEGEQCGCCGAAFESGIVVPPSQKNVGPEDASWLSKCPICKSGRIEEITQKFIFGLIKSVNFECNHCKAVFKQKDDGFQLINIDNPDVLMKHAYSHIMRRFEKKVLNEREWKNIAYGGFLDNEISEIDRKVMIFKLYRGEIHKLASTNCPIQLNKNEDVIFLFLTYPSPKCEKSMRESN